MDTIKEEGITEAYFVIIFKINMNKKIERMVSYEFMMNCEILKFRKEVTGCNYINLTYSEDINKIDNIVSTPLAFQTYFNNRFCAIRF